ncbi:MAG: threonine--tRNA ligase, partial [Gemmatimonadetes bacterium]|nr:threonine--tRNA ligase [Gemmatimonadota bacterium]
MTKEERLERLRHSAAHVMAEAVVEMFPDARIGIGPPIDTGFYYDFELPRALTLDDLPEIEKRMRKRIKSNVAFEPSSISKDEARKLFKDQPYKLELIDEIADEEVGLYRQGEFVDLCQGPHVERTGQVPAFKLMSVAGAYWRGSEENPMLQR